MRLGGAWSGGTLDALCFLHYCALQCAAGARDEIDQMEHVRRFVVVVVVEVEEVVVVVVKVMAVNNWSHDTYVI